nr:FAD-containing oxidoreductase [Acuticoccus kandeliae]
MDAIVIGAGQAGPTVAARLAGAGKRVVLIERAALGGTCVNTGCTPTKAMVASAYAAHLARRAADFGVSAGPVGVDLAAVVARKDRVVARSRDGLEDWLGATEGLTLKRGHARFVAADAVEVAGERIEAPLIVLNVGGRPSMPDFPGVADVASLNSSTILDLSTLPRHLVVVGGSYVGLEFAQMFRRFGAAVTIVERAPRLVAREDEATSEALAAILREEGITVRTGADCIALAPHPDGVNVHVSCTEGAPEVVGSHVLLAVGRVPNTDDLGLPAAGVATDARGFITVDDRLQTNVPGIYALGDCNGRGAFTHTAYNDGEILTDNLLSGDDRKVSDRIPAYALYTDPPLGRVGLSVAEAKAAGHRVLVGERPMTRVARAVEKGETAGFMKVVVDADSGRILGAALLGVGADEAVHAILAAMAGGLDARGLARTVFIHPTVSELIPTILGELKPVA